MTTPGSATLVPVLANHRFDEAALGAYLSRNLPGFRGPLTIRQFQGGKSNPTFHVQTPPAAYVLRKKPPGKLLASAHAIDREFKVLRALADTDVPTPKALLICTDETVIGQMFYLMEHIDGRVFPDRLLPGCSPGDRAAMYDDMNRILALLHQVDYRAVGLEGFGRPENYAARQIARWSRQYQESKVVEVPEMDLLIDWFARRPPPPDETAIAHGDYRLGNLIFHPTEPKVVAVLDWELSTIGHPLADLGYNCLAYRLPAADDRGFGDLDLAELGIPSEQDYLAAYCRRTGRDHIADWNFFLVLSMFRTVAILVGVHRRAVDGNAADAAAVDPEAYKIVAERAWAIAQDA